jgi:hypothetical protein
LAILTEEHNTMELQCSSGKTNAEIGDRFTDHSGEWEIVSFTDQRTYSPSVLGGTPVVVVKPIGMDMPSWFREYANDDGTIVFCGDSVAASLLDKNDGKKRSSRGAILTTSRS